MHYQEKAVQYFFLRSGRSLPQKGNEKNVGGCSIFYANANIWVYLKKFDFAAEFRDLEITT